jgi:hypothetical protein
MKGSFPNEALFKSLRIMQVGPVIDFMLEIPAISILHNYAEGLHLSEIEGRLIGNDVRHADGGEESYLIESCIFLFLLGIGQEH